MTRCYKVNEEGAKLQKTNQSLPIKHAFTDASQVLGVMLGFASLTLWKRVRRFSQKPLSEERLTQLLLKTKENIKVSKLFPVPY
jgi:hypothetical protein